MFFVFKAKLENINGGGIVRQKRFFVACFFTLFALFTIIPVASAGIMDLFSDLSPEDVGSKPRIKPHFHAQNGFNSNANLDTNQGDAAWQARISPGVTVSIPIGSKLYTEVDYTYSFSTTQGRKTTANVNSHNLSAMARYELTEDTTLGASNNLQFSEIPGVAGRTFMLETATGQASHRFGPKLSTDLTYVFQFFKDRSPNIQARRSQFIDNKISAIVNYDVTDELTLSPLFVWNVRDFKARDNKDYFQIAPQLAGTYKLGPKTTLSGNIGWALRDFDDGGTENEIVYGVGLNHLMGRKFTWGIEYQKALQDTFDTGFVFRDDGEAITLDNLDRRYRVVKTHRISTSATYHFNEKNSLGIFGDFLFTKADANDNVESGVNNNEKMMELGSKYRYRFNRFFNLDLGYTFGRRFSSQTSTRREEYTFHNVTGGLNITV